MTDTETVTLVTSLIVAVLSGAISLRNSNKSNENALAIQDFKGNVDRELELLKARLSYGQVVSSTQWNAEFSSYQAIWKGIVAVRTTAEKIVRRENELIKLGLPAAYLASGNRVEITKDLIAKLADYARNLLSAVHDNAPFYPASIRKAANDTHAAARYLIDLHLTALTRFTKGNDYTNDPEFMTETETTLRAIFDRVDLVEPLIRTRLEAIVVR